MKFVTALLLLLPLCGVAQRSINGCCSVPVTSPLAFTHSRLAPTLPQSYVLSASSIGAMPVTLGGSKVKSVVQMVSVNNRSGGHIASRQVQDTAFVLYPNPLLDDQLHITLPDSLLGKPISLGIVNQSGQRSEVPSSSIVFSGNTLDVLMPRLAQGMYMMFVSSEGNVVKIAKVIVGATH